MVDSADELRFGKLRVPAEPEGPSSRHAGKRHERDVLNQQSVFRHLPKTAFVILEQTVLRLPDEASLGSIVDAVRALFARDHD